MKKSAIFTAQPDTLSSLSWDYQGQTVTINQTKAGWVVDGQDQFPLDQGLPKVMASRLKAVGLSTLTEFDPDPQDLRPGPAGADHPHRPDRRQYYPQYRNLLPPSALLSTEK